MPKPKPARTARRVRMVQQKLAGKSVTEIARDEGLSREWTGRELASGEARQIVVQLVDRDLQRIGQLFDKALTVVEQAFGAEQLVNTLAGVVVVGPDHYARLAAAQRFLGLITAGRPMPRPPDEGKRAKTVTLAELEAIVREGKPKKAVIQ